MNNIFASTFFVFTLLTVNAQKFELGIRVGANGSNQSSHITLPMTDDGTKYGFLIGVYSRVKFGIGNGGIQSELYYSQMGRMFQNIESQANYLSVPILGRYDVDKYFHLLAGPQFGIPVGSQNSSTDLGAALGAGLDIQKFNVGLRLYFGLSDAYRSNSSLGTSIMNNTLQVVLGYRVFSK